MLANSPERFDQLDISDQKVLPVMFQPGDIIIMDVKMKGSLSVDTNTAEGNLVQQIVNMFPSAVFNNFFTYTEDRSMLILKSFIYRIKLIAGEPQEILSDPILNLNKSILLPFNTTSAPIQNTLTIIQQTEGLSLETLTNSVYNDVRNSDAHKKKNKEAMNALYERVHRLAILLQKPVTISPRDVVRIITMDLIPILSDCLMLFTCLNVDELQDPNNYDPNSVINIVGVTTSLKKCTKQLALLSSLAYNPVMNTADFYSFALRLVQPIIISLIDITKYASNLISKTVDQSTLAYPFSEDVSLSTAESTIMAFANTKYMAINQITLALETVENVQERPEKITDLLRMNVLRIINLMFISLANKYSIVDKNINEDRTNYPDPNIVKKMVTDVNDAILSIDLVTDYNTFMPKLFNSTTCICALLGELLTPNYFDLKGFTLNYIFDEDRKNLLDALANGAQVKNNVVKYTYKYTPVAAPNPSTLRPYSDETLDNINNILTSSAQIYNTVAKPLGQSAIQLISNDYTIEDKNINTVNPTQYIQSTATNELTIISKKVDTIINVLQFDEQTHDIYNSLVGMNLQNIESFSFALLDTLAFAKIKALLSRNISNVLKYYGLIQVASSSIQTFVNNNSDARVTKANGYLTLATTLTNEIEVARQRAYYALTERNFSVSVIYCTLAVNIAENIFIIYLAIYLLLDNIQHPNSDLIQDRSNAMGAVVETVTASVASSLTAYGQVRPVISPTDALAAYSGILTSAKSSIIATANALAASGQSAFDTMTSTSANYSLAAATITKMNTYKSSLQSITFPSTPMDGNLVHIKRLYNSIVLASTVGLCSALISAIIENVERDDNQAVLSKAQSDLAAQETFVASPAYQSVIA
jgi:hypothetical protein